MSQHDYILENANGAAFRSDMNSALGAVATLNSGASAPATTYPFMLWADSATGYLKQRNAANDAWVTVGVLGEANLGLQAYDADTAKTDVAQTWVAAQRTQETTDNDGSFDLNAALDFECTPTAGFTLTFTNIPASPNVQRGSILLVNGANYAAAAHANTKVTSALLTTISATGTYIVAYETRNGLAYVTSAGAFA